MIPLTDDQLVLEDSDLGVTFRVGTAAALNPALRSCSLRVCRELPGPESGLGGGGECSSCTAVFTGGEWECGAYDMAAGSR